MTTSTTTIATVSEPAILSANVYFWTAFGNSSQRAKNEANKIAEVASYLEAIGFIITDRNNCNLTAVNGNVDVQFHYSESSKNVYKSLSVMKDGKKSNISTLRKIAKSL